MKSTTYLSAKFTDDDRVKVDINGPAIEVMELLEEETVSIFNSFKEAGYSDTMAVFCQFFQNVTKEVFGIEL